MKRSLLVPLTAVALTLILAAPVAAATEERFWERSRSAGVDWGLETTGDPVCREDVPRPGLMTCTEGSINIWRGTDGYRLVEDGEVADREVFTGHQTCLAVARSVRRPDFTILRAIRYETTCIQRNARRLDVGFDGLRKAWVRGKVAATVIRYTNCLGPGPCDLTRSRERIAVDVGWMREGPAEEEFWYGRSSRKDCEHTDTGTRRLVDEASVSGTLAGIAVPKRAADFARMASTDYLNIAVCTS